MSLFTLKGVVIKVSDYGENNKIIWIYTDKLGKISTIAKGAKSSKSKFLSITLPFSFGEFVVFRGKNMYTLSEGKLIDSFQDLLSDLSTITYASYACELIDIALVEEESNRELFKEFVSTLYLLKSRAIDEEVLIRAFELRVLKFTGYDINFTNCSYCRKPINSSNYISLQYFGGVCEECSKINGVNISKAAYNVLKFLNSSSLDKIYRVNISKDIKKEIAKVLSVFISTNYSRIPKSLQMLDFIKESE